MTELALNTPLTSQQRNYLQLVKQSGDTLLTLLNGVLDLSKIEAGRMDLEFIPFSLAETVAGAVRLLAASASQKGIELLCRVAPNVPAQVCGDPTRLRQILVNLVGNAVKFTSEGDICVEVVVEPSVSGARQLHVRVQDSGIGIPADKIDSIFQAFQQADSSTTRRFGGTGLGLAISAQLAALMGGRIWAESEVGRGSTFHVVIPLHTILETAGAAVAPVTTAAEAWATVGEQSINERASQVVLVDLHEHQSQCERFLEELAANDRWQTLPLVMLMPAGKPAPAMASAGCRRSWRNRLRRQNWLMRSWHC
jgi:hypothetical protein